jgi:hypothetical protein
VNVADITAGCFLKSLMKVVNLLPWRRLVTTRRIRRLPNPQESCRLRHTGVLFIVSLNVRKLLYRKWASAGNLEHFQTLLWDETSYTAGERKPAQAYFTEVPRDTIKGTHFLWVYYWKIVYNGLVRRRENYKKVQNDFWLQKYRIDASDYCWNFPTFRKKLLPPSRVHGLSCVLKVWVTYRAENKGPSFVGDELTRRCQLMLLI